MIKIEEINNEGSWCEFVIWSYIDLLFIEMCAYKRRTDLVLLFFQLFDLSKSNGS